MPWVKLDDQFPGHPKVAMLSPAWRPLAVFLHINGLCWCNQYLTDGRIPKSIVSRLASEVECLEMAGRGPLHPGQVAEELVSVGLWEDDGDDYLIHDFHDFQPTKREVEARRKHINEIRKQAGSKGGSKPKANGKQVGKQCGSPVPVPVPGVLSSNEDTHTNPRVLSVVIPSADNHIDVWVNEAKRHGVDLPMGLSYRESQHIVDLSGVYSIEDFTMAVSKWWSSPFVNGRNVGLFRSQLPEVLAHIKSGAAYPFRGKPPIRSAEQSRPALKPIAQVFAEERR